MLSVQQSRGAPVYKALGASSDKEELHAALSGLPSKKLYPHAFCRLWQDAASEGHFAVLHADGVGTKASLAYLYWSETNDLSVWHDLAQDALVMNTDDVLCVGATQGPYLFSSSIARNKKRIPEAVLRALIEGTQAFIEQLNKWGIAAIYCGGETADVGDTVRTLVVDATLHTRLPSEEIIDNGCIKHGDVIVGLGSEGVTAYDKRYNSGIGCNGLTLARHMVLSNHYAKQYPESYSVDELKQDKAYQGSARLQDPLAGTPLSVGRALLSPTRSYLPLMREILETYRGGIHGMVHCTGSGQTKLLRLVREKKWVVVKDNLFEVPAVFELIQRAGNIPWREMYQVFNMGHRLELYTDKPTAAGILALAKKQAVPAQIIGRIEDGCATKRPPQIELVMPDGARACYL